MRISDKSPEDRRRGGRPREKTPGAEHNHVIEQDKNRQVGHRTPSAKERELRASGRSVRASARSELLSAQGKVDASICKRGRRARVARTGGTHAAGTSRSRQQSVARGIGRLSPTAVAEREQAERKEQQWQKENMATAHHEHDHGNCEADSKHTHQRTPSKQCLSGPARQPAPNERRPARTCSPPTSFRPPAPRPARPLFLRRGSRSAA
jgi:hypothetical protein